MSEPIPVSYALFDQQAAKDAGHLRSIAICHYIWGGLTILFSSLFIIHIVMGTLMISGRMSAQPTGPGAPTQHFMGTMFVIIGAIAIALGWSVGILTIVSGRAIAKRRWRVFSLVMAGINCASFPLGTLLGVFTFIVLSRPSVRAAYQ